MLSPISGNDLYEMLSKVLVDGLYSNISFTIE